MNLENLRTYAHRLRDHHIEPTGEITLRVGDLQALVAYVENVEGIRDRVANLSNTEIRNRLDRAFEALTKERP